MPHWVSFTDPEDDGNKPPKRRFLNKKDRYNFLSFFEF